MMSYQKDLEAAHDLLDDYDDTRLHVSGGYPHQMMVLGTWTVEATVDHDDGPALYVSKNADLVKAIRKARKCAARDLGMDPDEDEYADAVREYFGQLNPMG